MVINTFICTPHIPLDHHKRQCCYNNSSLYRSGISNILQLNSRLLDVFTWVLRIIENFIHTLFFFWKGEDREKKHCQYITFRRRVFQTWPKHYWSSTDFLSLPSNKQCRLTDRITFALPVLILMDHDPASVWKLCRHISMALCPLNSAWLINSDTQLCCAVHSSWWSPKSLLTGSMNIWLSKNISVVTPKTQ